MAIWKHKAIGEFFKGKSAEITKKAEENAEKEVKNASKKIESRLTGRPEKTGTHMPVSNFRNSSEVVNYFRNEYGMKVFIPTNLTQSELAGFKQVDTELRNMKDLGLDVEKVKSMNLFDWNDETVHNTVYDTLNIERPDSLIYDILKSSYARAPQSRDGNLHLMLNRNFAEWRSQGVTTHEFGHLFNYSNDTVFDTCIAKGSNKGTERLRLLTGASTPIPDTSFNPIRDKGWNRWHGGLAICPSLSDADIKRPALYLNYSNIFSNVFEQEIEKSYDYWSIISNCFNEYIADTFKMLVNGKKVSDEVLLAYDFCGGSRVPGLKIKGQNYDDYVAGLYTNNNLVQKVLRDNIECLKAEDFVRG